MHEVECGKVKRVLKYIGWTVGGFLIVLLLFLGSLFFREQRLPRFVVSMVERRLSTEEFRTRIDWVSFGFRHGLRLQGVRVYDLRKVDCLESPIGVAQVATFDAWNDTVDILGLEYRRLPDSFYHAGEEGGQTEFDLPDLPNLKVRLERPVILGTNPDRVEFQLEVGNRRLEVKDLRVEMPERDRKLHLDGEVSVDFATKEVSGRLYGSVGYTQIAPVLMVWGAGEFLPYVEAFTEVKAPLGVGLDLRGDLEKGTLSFGADLDIPTCRYNGVPLAKVKGRVEIDRRYEDGELKWSVKNTVKELADFDGRQLSGSLTVDNRDGRVRLRYENVKSALQFDDLLGVVDAFDKDTFSMLTCDSPLELTICGSCATSAEDLPGNDLKGHVSLRHGKLFGLVVDDVSSDFTFKEDKLETSSTAKGKKAGRIEWRDKVFLEGFDRNRMHFSVTAAYTDGKLEELSDLFSFELGDRHGMVNGSIELNGMVGTNLCATLNGHGHVVVSDGKLAQMKLFAGLTEILADTVPGVSHLVNLSDSSADFEIDDGVIKSENVVIEGKMIRISGCGSYDLVRDDLDFVVRVELKGDSLVGKGINRVTAPIVRTLLKFKLKGPLSAPTWHQISLTDQIFGGK